MISLIKNELFKVFHKKNIYIFLAVILGFCLLNNISYRLTYDDNGFYINDNKYDYFYLEDLKMQLDMLDPMETSQVEEYVEVKTNYDIEKIIIDNNFGYDSWQYSVIHQEFFDVLYNINYYTYIEKNEDILLDYQEEYNKLLYMFKNDDWKRIVNNKLDVAKNDLELLKKEININNTLALKEQEERMFYKNLEIELLELRLEKGISYANSYLNDAIINYEDTSVSLYSFNKDRDVYSDKIMYQSLLEDNAVSKYILDTGYNVNKENSLRTLIKDFIVDYEMFIIIFVVIIASSVVSSEFKDGTIKLLLSKPYTRNEILLSKYFTCLISFGIIVLYTFICQLIVGGLCFGIDSLEIPVLIYNFDTNNLIEYNVFIYVLFIILCKLPIFVLMITLAFCISVLFNSNSVSYTFTILTYMFKDLILVFVSVFNWNFLKYFFTLNWDFTEYLYGKLPTIEGLSLIVSIIVCVFYYLIMIISTFIVFKRKNVKNI